MGALGAALLERPLAARHARLRDEGRALHLSLRGAAFLESLEPVPPLSR